ncbi:hypothetical protein GCM10020001_049520 [Nonomuraea salmonea]
MVAPSPSGGDGLRGVLVQADAYGGAQDGGGGLDTGHAPGVGRRAAADDVVGAHAGVQFALRGGLHGRLDEQARAGHRDQQGERGDHGGHALPAGAQVAPGKVAGDAGNAERHGEHGPEQRDRDRPRQRGEHGDRAGRGLGGERGEHDGQDDRAGRHQEPRGDPAPGEPPCGQPRLAERLHRPDRHDAAGGEPGGGEPGQYGAQERGDRREGADDQRQVGGHRAEPDELPVQPYPEQDSGARAERPRGHADGQRLAGDEPPDLPGRGGDRAQQGYLALPLLDGQGEGADHDEHRDDQRGAAECAAQADQPDPGVLRVEELDGAACRAGVDLRVPHGEVHLREDADGGQLSRAAGQPACLLGAEEEGVLAGQRLGGDADHPVAGDGGAGVAGVHDDLARGLGGRGHARA